MRWTLAGALVALVPTAGCNQHRTNVAQLGSTDGVQAPNGDAGPDGGTGGALPGEQPDEQDERYARALAQWAGTGVDSYTMLVDRSCFCVYEPADHVRVSVANGVVQAATGRAEASIDAEYTIPIPKSDYRAWYTVNGLFDVVEEAGQEASQVSVSYDAEYGFPDKIDLDFILQVADDELHYSVREFSLAM